jgi:hypothetical protein
MPDAQFLRLPTADGLFRQAVKYAEEAGMAPTSKLRNVLTLVSLRYATLAGQREEQKTQLPR